jgi:hypothetical protein
MRTKPLESPFACGTATVARVQQLDDAALRGGHALLDQTRVRDFASWMDERLLELGAKFGQYQTRSSVRKYLQR